MNAYDCGKKAYENKQPRVPAFDADFMRHISSLKEHKSEAFKAWLIGWDSANIKTLLDSEFMDAHFSNEYERDRLAFCGYDDSGH